MLQQSVDVITDWSRRNDMRIYARKTKEMIICFCRNDNHVASIPRIVLDDNYIDRVTQANVLGVTLSSDLSWNAHVDTIVSKDRKRVFTIYQLKRAGIRQCDLLRVYVTVIRPVLEYACPVWHSSLPMYLSDHIETIQKRCLRSIFPGYSYDEARSISKLPTLFERRTKLCQSSFRKMQNADHKLHKLLPRIIQNKISHSAHPMVIAATVAPPCGRGALDTCIQCNVNGRCTKLFLSNIRHLSM